MEVLKAQAPARRALRVLTMPVEGNPEPVDVFRVLDPRSRPAWLDSSDPSHDSSRFSYVAWDPWGCLQWDGRARWEVRRGEQPLDASDDPFEALRCALGGWRVERDDDRFPFACGAVGYLAYELGGVIEKLPAPPPDDMGFPPLHMHFYGTVYAFDHASRQGVLYVAVPEDASRGDARGRIDSLRRWLGAGTAEGPAGARSAEPVAEPRRAPQRDTTHAEYLRMVETGRRYIADGDIFQVNLSQRFAWDVAESPAELYLRLRERHPAPYSAYLSVGNGRAVLSVSPELYLSLRGRDVLTRPIKGTRPRAADALRDLAARRELLGSEKDRAELIMIVDLERNDLGRVCEFGSVRVNRLADLETFATVHHLVAEVEGKLRAGLDVVDLIRASFPGGSVTGAPKIRAMEIIAEQERTARSVYTGSVGWIGLDGNAELNIAIRTVLREGQRAVYRVGGAIVADSIPQLEYEETLHKGRALYETLARW